MLESLEKALAGVGKAAVLAFPTSAAAKDASSTKAV